MDGIGRTRSAGAVVDALERRLFLDSSVRIDAGGPAFKDSSGLTWAADNSFTGGTAVHAALAIAGTTADPLYYNYRSGNFSYAIPAVNGSYSLRLLFAEPTMTAKGKRTFNVFAERQPILSNFDLFVAGGTKNAITKTFTVNVADGQLNLNFQGVINAAVVSAIQTTLTAAAVTTPIPSAPVALTPLVNGSAGITVSWQPGANATAYLVQRSSTGTGGWAAIGPAEGVTGTSYIDNGLSPTTTYFYQIFSKNSAGTSTVASNVVSAMTTIAAPPAPGPLTIEVELDNSVSVSWNGVDSAATYTLQKSLSGLPGSWSSKFTTVDNTTLVYVDQDVSADTTYYYRLIATNAGGDSPASTVAHTPLVPAYSPGTLVATAVSGLPSINLAWDGAGNAAQYIIERSLPDTGSGYDWQQIGATTGALSNSYSDSGLPFDTTYVYQVTASNDAGPSLPTAVAVATTVPASPDPLIVTAVSFGEIDLSWSDVAGETGFLVERNGVAIGSTAAGILSYPDLNLSPGTSYTYRVRATSDAGFSAYTVLRTAATQGTTKFLNVGGPVFIDSVGNHWAADTGAGWSGGNASTGTAAVANTVDDALFDSRRSGATMSYTSPADNGTYQLDLYFVDPTMTAVGKRVFNVSAQGIPILTNFDIVKTRGANTANIQSFQIVISTGQLNLAFNGIVYYPIISAIHLKPLAPPAPPDVPVAFSAGPFSSTGERLTWTESAASSVSSFVIERFDPVAGGFSTIATVPGGARGYTDPLLTANSQYQYEIQAVGPGGVSAVSDPISGTTISALPEPWVDGDVGSAGLTGGAGAIGTAISISGSGADMYGTSDGFHFVYQPVTGDVTIIAQITSQQNTDPWARAGLAIRQSLANSAAMADMILTPGNGVVFQNRLTSGASASGLMTFPATTGVWLKLVRNVNTITGYFSPDGFSWTVAGTQTFAAAGTVYVGLCVCAHHNGLLNVSTFDNVSVTTAQAFQWTAGADEPLTTFESPNAVVGDNFYIFGGFYNVGLKATKLSNVYNLDSNSWAPIAPMPIAVTHAGVAVVGTDIYFAGGFLGDWPSSITGQFMKYDTLANSWTVLTPLPAARGAGGMVLLGNKLHFFGGLNSTKTTDMGTQWIYDLDNPAAGWTGAAPMPGPRNHFGYVGMNGLAYAIGGQHLLDEDHSNQTEVDVYDPVADQWKTVAPLSVARSHNHTSTFTYRGKIVIITGQENGPSKAQTVADAMAYDPVADQWAMLTSAAPAVREATAAKVIGDTVVLVGGADAGHVPQLTNWIGDLSSIFSPVIIPPIESELSLQPLQNGQSGEAAQTTANEAQTMRDIALSNELAGTHAVLFDLLPQSR